MSAKNGILAFVSSLIILTIVVSVVAFGKRITVETFYGPIEGRQLDGINHFYSVPFAQAPIGNLRWQAPQAPKVWKEVREALDKPPACFQGGDPNPAVLLGESEDCLYLNVWAPSTPGPHPVMVWFHGGGFVLGSGSEGSYDGEKLARDQNVIVVTVNYRLSYLGFLRVPQYPIHENKPHNVIGNQGFLDQVAALQWVQDSIEPFGGDKSNVTIFGESAGSISVCMLLASPLTDHLIDKAIMQSGPCGISPTLSVTQAEQYGAGFLEKVECASKGDPIECARAKSHEEIYAALGIEKNEIFKRSFEDWSFMTAGVSGTAFLPDEPYKLLASSAKADTLALMIGTNADEGSMFDGMQAHAESEEAWPSFLEARYPSKGKEIASLYPYDDFQPSGEASAQIITDSVMTCPSLGMSELWSKNHPVYFYHFTQRVTAPIFDLMSLAYSDNAADLGVAHSTEIPYIFKVNGVLGLLVRPDQKKTSIAMQQYWGNFAHSGNPNDGELNNWPAFTTENPEYLILDSAFLSSSNLRNEYCEYWKDNPVIF